MRNSSPIWRTFDAFEIYADWQKMVYLKDGQASNLIYQCNELDDIPNSPGVYIFGREHGDKITPLYIGRATKLRQRLDQQIHSVKLKMSIKNAERGKRLLIYCTLRLRPGQRPVAVLQTLESALIAHSLAEGHQLFNDKGTKFKQHTVNFTGNRISECLAPRFMLIRSR